MIPILYDSNETSFTSNGLGRLRDIISCRCTEERNGIFECDFEYPANGQNYDRVLLGRTIAAKHDDSEDIQPFDIVSNTEPINGIVKYHAVHISYRQSKLTAFGTGINSLAAAFAMLNGAQPDNPFIYETDKAGEGYLAAGDGVPRSVKSILGGIEGSILDTYGGEYKYNKFIVSLLTSRGSDRGFTVRYGVNLLDYNNDTNYSESFNSCIPYWAGTNSSGDPLVVRGARVDSGLPSYNGRIECVPLDLTSKFESQPTATQVEAAARAYLQNNQVNLPAQTIKVNFIRLQESEEYAEYAALLDCNLCDTVRVIFPRYKMDGRFKIVKTVYNSLTERYEEMELGALSITLSQALGLSK